MAQQYSPLQGFLMGQKQVADQGAQEMGILSKILQMKQMQDQAAIAAADRAEMRPLQMDALRSQIEARNVASQGALQQRQAQGMLSGLLANGGYTGPTTAPTAVAGSDAEALRMMQEAEAQGREMGVNVPSPTNVRALTSIAFPAEYGKAQAAALFPKPVAPQTPRQSVVPVTGGYLQANASGQMEFVRTQQPGENRAEPMPIQVKDDKGNVKLYDRRGDIIRDLGQVAAPSATNQKSAAAKIQLNRDLDQAITELTAATADGGLIDKSTGSGAGALVDAGAGFFGKATPGSIAVGQMKPIFDLVLKMVPRFEGPQSDKDTASYKEAAGDIANPNVPNERKKAAGKEILRLMKSRRNQFISKDMAGTEADVPSGAGSFEVNGYSFPNQQAMDAYKKAAGIP